MQKIFQIKLTGGMHLILTTVIISELLNPASNDRIHIIYKKFTAVSLY